MHRLTLKFPWSEGDRTGCVEAEISASMPREYYGAFRGEGEPTTWQRHARICAHGARSLVAFMDATGLALSRDHDRIFGENSRMLPAGADHTRIWRGRFGDEDGYLVTTEPYANQYETVEEWCRAHDWKCATLPPRYGFHLPTGRGGTRLVLISPLSVGLPLASLCDRLVASLPRWTEAGEEEE